MSFGLGRRVKLLGVAVVLLAVGGGSFLGARVLANLGKGERPTTSGGYFSVEGEYFEGTINGIRVITGKTWKAEGSWPQDDCAVPVRGAHNYPVSHEEIAGTPLAINPTYLPAGAVEQVLDPKDYYTSPALVCEGRVSHTLRLYETSSGIFWIEKWRGPHTFVGDLLADYVGPGEVNGKPAIFVRRMEYPPN